MDLRAKVRPINENHSIKEAVLSVFLATKIIKPERFNSLIEKELKGKFQQFELVSRFNVTISQKKSVLEHSSKALENVGFRFLSFKAGKPDRILQAINEENRYFISFHCLSYTRWADFYNEFKSLLQVLTDFQPGYFANAFSLHYIDQFLWLDESSEIEPAVIFNKESDYLPGEFFKSKKTTYSVVTEKDLPGTDGLKIFDRIGITVEPNIKPMVSISHNVTMPLADYTDLGALIQGGNEKLFTDVHSKNKEFLRNVLNKEICSMIKIN